MSPRTFSIASLALAALLLVTAGASAQGAERKIRVSMSEYKFQPARFTLQAGERVTLTLVNESKKKEHELMAGRDVVKGGPFGDRPDGYQVDFFEGVEVEVVDARAVSELMAGKARVKGKAAMGMAKEIGRGQAMGKEMGHGQAASKGMGRGQSMGKEMGHGQRMGKDMGHGPGAGEQAHRGFMIELEPGGTATISFTVPKDKGGTWELGCFSEDGQHYQEGMKASWEVKG